MIIMLGIFLGWLLFMFGLAWFGFQFNFLFGMIPIGRLYNELEHPIKR